ncbi:MAG: nucleotide sugar dehydrogenase [Inquilinaceae bacterium]
MKLSIFGLGYVGTVSAACFANAGIAVVAVDPQPLKVDLINEAKVPIVEAGLAELISATVPSGKLRATTSAAEAVAATDVSMICVGTPSRPNGSLDTSSIERVCEEIGAALKEKKGYHVVVIRSTILPGTMKGVVQPILEKVTGLKAGKDFGLCNNPEFLRESTAVKDFLHPPKTVIGASDDRAGDMVEQLYKGIDGPMIRTSVEVAEIVKYTDNVWHAVKVAFGNEIGNICKAVGIDSHEVMDIFCQDTKLNLSPYYLKPGFAFGGSCLPKDLRALTYQAKTLDLDLPVLNSVMESNRVQMERGIRFVLEKDRKRVGVLGFSFKAGTDDLRESPLVEMIERLLGKGIDLKLYDKNVNFARLMGANRDYIMQKIPHITTLMVDSVEQVLDHAEVIIIGNNDPAFHAVPEQLRPEQILIDMVRVPKNGLQPDRYDGINW